MATAQTPHGDDERDGCRMRDVRGLDAPTVFGEPDDLAGTRSRCTEPCDEDTDSRILSEAASSGIQGGDNVASGEGGRNGRSLAAEGATAHVCAAVHNTPPRCYWPSRIRRTP